MGFQIHLSTSRLRPCETTTNRLRYREELLNPKPYPNLECCLKLIGIREDTRPLGVGYRSFFAVVREGHIVRNRHLTPEGDPLWDVSNVRRESEGEARARAKLKRLWQPGDLFHMFFRYPRNPEALKLDRLASVLRQGLVAPASCPDGSVCSDLHLVVMGLDVSYDSLVFLHRFGPDSGLYTMFEPGRLAAFIDPDLPVLTPQEMGPNWVVLCQDEVYVRDRIAAEHIIGIAIHPDDAEAVMEGFLSDLQRFGIPLYRHDGTALWPPG